MNENKLTNCKNCGSVLRYYKCEYCGADYRDQIPIVDICIDKPEYIELGARVCSSKIDHFNQDRMEREQYIKSELAYELAKEIIKHTDIFVDFDPLDFKEYYLCTIKVKKLAKNSTRLTYNKKETKFKSFIPADTSVDWSF